jgi:carboxyl-terminal processing protease
MRYAILTNGITASASELFAGCLRDYGKAVIIGEQTFGKGSGTITITLEDGSAVNLTNFLYYLPGGESIEGVGLTPDQVVALPEDARGISLNRLTIDQDTQLFAAITALEKLE